MKKKITSDMSMSEILMANKKAPEILLKAGMGCFGCPMAQMESLKDGCLAHGISEKEIEKIVKELNALKGTSK